MVIKHRAFVSYSRHDQTFAERLARDLNDAGLDIWIDFRKIKGGEAWRQAIFKGIEQAEIVVICLSPSAAESEWVHREILMASSQHKLIIPVMVADCLKMMAEHDETSYLLDLQIIPFEALGYEKAFPLLLEALPGLEHPQLTDDSEIDISAIPNPFKGLEAFQQTDARIFFGRQDLVEKCLDRLRSDQDHRFLAVVGASGSGKSSLVRAGVIPALRAGRLPDSAAWPLVVFAPGARPTEAMASRLLPLIGRERTTLIDLVQKLESDLANLHLLVEDILSDAPTTRRCVLVVDQFEEVFTRASQHERDQFLGLINTAVGLEAGRTLVIVTMRADFFDRLSGYPDLAVLFEQEHMVIATEMTPENLRQSIEGPAQVVGLAYDQGLTDRILEDVRQQPGSLPLLQYALKELYERRSGRNLTTAAYEEIGGVQRALAQHAEDTYIDLDISQRDIMQRVLLRLVEVSETGEATRRRVEEASLTFRGAPDDAVQEVVVLLTAPETRLLIASREISTEEEDRNPSVFLEVSHEALIREWGRFKGWIAENEEDLRYDSELLKAAEDWDKAQRDPAYLLTGTRLGRAQSWLETADANELQSAFIRASVAEWNRKEAEERTRQEHELALQRRAANWLRALVAVLVVAVLATLGLAVFALRAEGLSQQNASEAHSLYLAASAQQMRSDNDPDLAVALALEASNIASPPPEVQQTLAEIVYAPGTRRRFEIAGVVAIAFSPDGRTALFGLPSPDNSIVEVDRESGGNSGASPGMTVPSLIWSLAQMASGCFRAQSILP